MPALDHTPDRFVALPFRRGEKDTPDWTECWRYISTHHPSNANTSVEEALKIMNADHNSIVKTCTHEAKSAPNMNFIEHTLKRYCKYVAMIQSHIPINDKVKMKFFWRDAFDDSIKYDSRNSNSELVSCIYNLAASYTSVAANNAQIGGVEDVKESFSGFQSAAGYYAMVESLLKRLPADQLTKGDLKRDSLDLAKKLCMAQAHHCGYLKAEVAMKGNQEMLSKIAMEGAKLYEEVAALMKSSVWLSSSSLPWKASQAKEADVQIQANKVIMEARANLHLAVKNEADGEMGVALAYYGNAKNILTRLPKMQTSSQTTWVNSIVNAVNAAHDAADKANQSVYFARVPKEVPTPTCLPRPLGVPTEHPSFVDFKSERGKDPFFGIVPSHIATAALQWRDKMREKANVCGNYAKTQRRATQDNLQRLGVSAAVQTVSGDAEGRGSVPEPLRSRLLQLREGKEGKVNSLTDNLIGHVKLCDELYPAVQNKIKDVKELLEKQKTTDAQYIEAYGEKMWRAAFPPCEQTSDYVSLQAALKEHEKGLEQYCNIPLATARKTLDDNMRDIARLDWPMTDLDALMPYSKTKESRQQSEKVLAVVAELKDILKQKDDQEDMQKTNLKRLQDTIESDEIINGLSAVDAGQREHIIQVNTQKVNDIIEEVNKCTRNQQMIVQSAEKAMSRMAEIQSADPQSAEIQKVANSLENAVSQYQELIKDFEEIATYAAKALENVEGTQSSVQSYALSRELEAQEVQNRLDSVIAMKMNQMQSPQQQQQRPTSAGPASPPAGAPQAASPNYQQQQQQQRPTSGAPASPLQQQQSYQPPQQQQQQSNYYYPPQQQQQQQRPSVTQPMSSTEVGGYNPPNRQQYQQPQQYQQQQQPQQYQQQQYQPQQQQHYQQPPPQQHYQQHAPPPPPQDDRPPSYDAVMQPNYNQPRSGPSYNPPAL